jgi:hypothetical protein
MTDHIDGIPRTSDSSKAVLSLRKKTPSRSMHRLAVRRVPSPDPANNVSVLALRKIRAAQAMPWPSLSVCRANKCINRNIMVHSIAWTDPCAADLPM